ncbi:MAG: hypothetical protein PHU25_09585 [Deltaproteobacteria bacterium]|nr:hypothetical protein [Deltaproteobacteria bacterium]
MSDGGEMRSDGHAGLDVVKLKIDGITSAVNTIRDQQTARGLSLVCPFPALEVDVPICFGGPTDGEMRKGTIHRIGVEDDPRTGLPRLRLSIRTPGSRATILQPPPESLLDEAKRVSAAPDGRAATDPSLEVGEAVGVDVTEASTPKTRPFDILAEKKGSDPAWVDCAELPLPSQMMSAKARTRRRKKAAGAAAWLAVMMLAAGGVYVMKRAGLVDLGAVREAVAGFRMETSAPPAPGPVAAKVEPAPVPEPVMEPEVASMVPEVEPTPTPTPTPTPEVASTPEPAAEAAPLTPVSGLEDVTITLPTRLPVEFVSAYRMRDPNGVVVDVPGGLVKREGWLDIGTGYPMIRSIKVVQRETGARFIVYVLGELPRYMTQPKPGGVSLRLVRGVDGEPAESDQIALLQK